MSLVESVERHQKARSAHSMRCLCDGDGRANAMGRLRASLASGKVVPPSLAFAFAALRLVLFFSCVVLFHFHFDSFSPVFSTPLLVHETRRNVFS